MVTRNELIAAVQADGLRNPGTEVETVEDTEFQISSHLIRCANYDGTPSVFVPSGDKDLIRNAVVDGVHWLINRHPEARSLALYVSEDTDEESLHALGTLSAACGTVSVVVYSYSIIAPQFSPLARLVSMPVFHPNAKVDDWAKRLDERDRLKIPSLASNLLEELSKTPVPAFRWYRNVTSNYWSGRKGGWEICRLRDGESTMTFRPLEPDVDEDDETNLAGSTNVTLFGKSDLAALAKKIHGFGRLDGAKIHKQEHLLESAILRSAVPVVLPGCCMPLEPIVPSDKPPLQVPALFGSNSKVIPRFIDAVMKQGTIPWVLELKVPTMGQGQYYRHAIAQAVLYRDFLRQAKGMHAWFEQKGVDPREFRGAVVFPKLRGADAGQLLVHHTRVARCFGIEVVELAWEGEELHKKCMS